MKEQLRTRKTTEDEAGFLLSMGDKLLDLYNVSGDEAKYLMIRPNVFLDLWLNLLIRDCIDTLMLACNNRALSIEERNSLFKNNLKAVLESMISIGDTEMKRVFTNPEYENTQE